MKVGEVMSRGIDPIAPTASVQDAALHMAEFDVGCVVVGSEDELVGILTDRDIILRVVVDAKPAASVRVGEVMSSSLFTCRSDDSLDDVFRMMEEKQIRRMPVLDESGKAVGIVTLSDIVKAGRNPLSAGAFRTNSEPHHRARLGVSTD